ncbi:MAG: hypothetical protein AAF806_00390 [Bacteroidota bacterium]
MVVSFYERFFTFVELDPIKSSKRDYNYTFGKDLDFIERARLILNLCNRIAQKEEIALFNNHTSIFIPVNIIEYIINTADEVMNNEDENERKMAMLMAESLHQHPEGMEYLYLRSKVFTSNRSELKLY